MAILDDYKELKFPKNRKITCVNTGITITFGEKYFAVYKDGKFISEMTICDLLNGDIIVKGKK